MAYPLNTEGLVNEESAPGEPLSEDLAAAGDLEVDDAGVEVAPTMSTEAVEAAEQLAARMRSGDTDQEAPE